MRPRPARLSLAQQLFGLQVAVALLAVALGAVLGYLDTRRDGEQATRTRVLAVAYGVADSGVVPEALAAPDPSARLQPAAEQVRRDTGVDFVVVMSTAGTRYSHPDPTLIGRQYVGTTAPAAAGRALTETYTGSLGPSVRAVVPVNQDGRVVALVAVGVTLRQVRAQVTGQLPSLAAVALLTLGLSALGAVLISRRLRRQTLGLEPVEITRMYEAHDAVLHAVREGLVVLDPERRLQLANDEAGRLLGLPPAAAGRRADELGLPPDLEELLMSGREATDEVHLTSARVLLVGQAAAGRGGRSLGTVTTLRDTTELQAVSGELADVRGLTEALRSQAHEAANRLHTVLTLVELGRPEEALRLGTAELQASQRLTDRMLSAVQEPVLAALLLGKAAAASERGIELTVSDATALPPDRLDPLELVTLVGNLLDNAFDAALSAPPPRRVAVEVCADGEDLVVRVADTGPGLPPEQLPQALTRGWSSKAAGRGRGLALVQQVVWRHGGELTVDSGGPGYPGAEFVVRLPRAPAP
ncbi:MAG TPA: sensor histidine kinase [Mycobacteriales bacterium]|nr:sensor histidine kinase [Mycobacteriales bacterium]